MLSGQPGRRYTRKLAPTTPPTRRTVKTMPFLVILLLSLLRLLLCVNLISIIRPDIYIIKIMLDVPDLDASKYIPIYIVLA